MKKPIAYLLLACVPGTVAAQNAPIPAKKPAQRAAAADAELQSYAAHIAAAASALRLNETSEAKRWLAGAPAAQRGWEWRYLSAQADQSIATIAAHEATVTHVSLSPDGKFAVTASADRTAKIWDLNSAKLVVELRGHTAGLWSAVFSPDGSKVLTAASDSTIRIWDAASGKELKTLKWNAKGIAAATWRPDGAHLAASSWDRSAERGVWGIVQVWDTATGEVVKQLEYGVKPMVSIAYSADGKKLAAATWDPKTALWDTETWQVTSLIPPKTEKYQAGQAVAFDPAGTKLAVALKDETVRVWDTATGNLIVTLGGGGTGHRKWVNGVTFTPDGKHIISASSDQTLRVWSAASGAELVALRWP